MNKIKGLLLGFIIAPLSCAMASKSTEATMGSKCHKGDMAFYAQLTRTYAEEKLCRISDDEWVFWTKDRYHAALGTKPEKVLKHFKRGESGYTAGYDVQFDDGETLELRAVYSNDNKIEPIAGFLIIEDDYADLEPSSIKIKL